MKLRDIQDVSFVAIGQDGSFQYLSDITGAHAILFECPCGQHSNLIAFEPTVDTEPTTLSGLSNNGGRWKRTGTTLDDLTLSPSIAVRTGKSMEECWHGWITNGEVE